MDLQTAVYVLAGFVVVMVIVQLVWMIHSSGVDEITRKQVMDTERRVARMETAFRTHQHPNGGIPLFGNVLERNFRE